MADLSIVGVPILIAFGVFSAAVVVAAVALRSRLHWWGEVIVGIFVLVLFAANVGGWINRHFDYYPTLQDLLGRTSADEASIGSLDTSQVPAQGKVVPIDIPGKTSGFKARTAYVYVPPAWFEKPRPKLPVIVLLPGEPSQTSDWTRAGYADVTSDAYARQHGGKAPIVVMADENGSITDDSECVNGPLGNVETYLTVDVPAFIEKRFDTATDPQQWAIAGLSEGGECSLMLALRNPDVYRTFADYSGVLGPRTGDTNEIGNTVQELFHGDQAAFEAHEPSSILRKKSFPQLGGWFEVGTGDADPYAAQQQLVPLARAAGIDTCAVTIPGGGHTFPVWAQSFRDSLPWIAGRQGITGPVACPDKAAP